MGAAMTAAMMAMMATLVVSSKGKNKSKVGSSKGQGSKGKGKSGIIGNASRKTKRRRVAAMGHRRLCGGTPSRGGSSMSKDKGSNSGQ